MELQSNENWKQSLWTCGFLLLSNISTALYFLHFPQFCLKEASHHLWNHVLEWDTSLIPKIFLLSSMIKNICIEFLYTLFQIRKAICEKWATTSFQVLFGIRLVAAFAYINDGIIVPPKNLTTWYFPVTY